MTMHPSPEPRRVRPLRLLHLGDSYTCAEGIDTRDGWPALLAGKVENTVAPVGEQRIIARTGWTTGKLLAALEESDPGGGWDLVTLCIGVNNQYRGLSVQAYLDDLAKLVGRCLEYAQPRTAATHLLSIPDWGVSPFAAGRDLPEIARQIDDFNSAARDAADRFHLPYHDWTPLTRQFAGRREAFAEDGLHPSASQQQAWVDFLMSRIGPMLKDSLSCVSR